MFRNFQAFLQNQMFHVPNRTFYRILSNRMFQSDNILAKDGSKRDKLLIKLHQIREFDEKFDAFEKKRV